MSVGIAWVEVEKTKTERTIVFMPVALVDGVPRFGITRVVVPTGAKVHVIAVGIEDEFRNKFKLPRQ